MELVMLIAHCGDIMVMHVVLVMHTKVTHLP
jgi:hypothetical protein